jgi:hypothetical protein
MNCFPGQFIKRIAYNINLRNQRLIFFYKSIKFGKYLILSPCFTSMACLQFISQVDFGVKNNSLPFLFGPICSGGIGKKTRMHCPGAFYITSTRQLEEVVISSLLTTSIAFILPFRYFFILCTIKQDGLSCGICT